MSVGFTMRRDRTRDGVYANTLRALQAAYESPHEWDVKIERHVKRRTDDQNRALYGVAYKALREQSGNDVDDLHTYFLGEFFGWVDYDVMGATRRKPARTTTTDEAGRRKLLSTAEFADFYDFIQRRAMEAGFIVPDPDPFWRDHKEAA